MTVKHPQENVVFGAPRCSRCGARAAVFYTWPAYIGTNQRYCAECWALVQALRNGQDTAR